MKKPDHIDRMNAARERRMAAREARFRERERRGIKLPLKPRDWKARRKARRKRALRSRKINQQRR